MFPRLRSPPVPAATGRAVVESTVENIPEIDVSRFARFLGALTSSSDVVFRVYKPDESELLQAAISRDGDVELSVLVGDEPALFGIAVEGDVEETNGEVTHPAHPGVEDSDIDGRIEVLPHHKERTRENTAPTEV